MKRGKTARKTVSTSNLLTGCRYKLSQPLLFKCYNKVLGEALEKIAEADFVTLTLDGWSRVQNSDHVLNFVICGYGFAIFLDVKVTGVDKVSHCHVFLVAQIPHTLLCFVGIRLL